MARRGSWVICFQDAWCDLLGPLIRRAEMVKRTKGEVRRLKTAPSLEGRSEAASARSDGTAARGYPSLRLSKR
jgi:hypothetical protein